MNFLKLNNEKRKKYLPVGGRSLKLPIYLPSISSVKTGKIEPYDYYRVLSALSPHFLVSAYDIYNSKKKTQFIKLLKKNMTSEQRAIIILDSGNYEKFWLEDNKWTVKKFDIIIKENICDIAFCYDNQSPPGMKKNIEGINASVLGSQKQTTKTSIVPIVHAKNREDIVKTVIQLHKKLNYTMVAVPERELGSGLMERVETITELRKKLNANSEEYTFLHILGTGNPLSLLLFSLAGADTFDGLEWCQTVVDPKTSLLYHFQQRELIEDGCLFCNANDIKYSNKTFGHNLQFFHGWMKKIQDAIESKTEEALIKEYFSEKVIKRLKTIWA
jgi:queuine/archaeosine tRNA-ribosyltransferase